MGRSATAGALPLLRREASGFFHPPFNPMGEIHMKKLLLIASLVLVSGCFTKSISSPMRPTPAPATAAPADKARVLVFRPGRAMGKLITHHVVDGDKAFIGDAFNDTVFATDVAPGEHQFCVGNLNVAGPLVTAKLAAGKTYLLRVDIGAARPYLTPMKAGSSDMKEAVGGLAETRGAELIGPSAEDALNADDVKALYALCNAALAQSTPEEKASFVLAEADAL